MNSTVHFKRRAVGCKWVQWLGAFWSWGHKLCLNHQQRPLIPVRDTSLWFRSPAQHRPSSEHTQTNMHMHTYVNLQHYYRVSGEVIVLLLLQHGLNSRQIWPQLVLLHFCFAGSSLNPTLTTWMVVTRGAALTPATRIKCHSGPYAVMQLLIGITVSYESWGSLMDG